MLRLKLLQNKVPIRTLVRPRLVHVPRSTFKTTIKNISTATATVVATQQQKTRFFSNLWNTSAALTATALTYGLLNNNVLALEDNDCNYNSNYGTHVLQSKH